METLNRNQIKKIIAREFLFLLGATILFFIIAITWDFIDDNFYQNDIITIIVILVSLIFILRYIVYATKWSIKQLKG